MLINLAGGTCSLRNKTGGRSVIKEGQQVIINECHSIPDLVGKTAEVITTEGIKLGSRYPIHVSVDGYEQTVGFREDELIAI